MRMKKKICMFMMTGLLFGCSSNEKPDQKLVCELTSNNGSQILESNVEVDFISKSGDLDQGVFTKKYNYLEKTETNNLILADMINRQSILEDLKGVEIKLKAADTSFDYQEIWDYKEVDSEEAIETDEEQKKLIDNGYSIPKIREYYEKQGHSCKIEDIK